MAIDSVSPPARSDAPFYLLAALAGMGTGWADVVVNDLLLTALLVLMACMLLGLLRPRLALAVGGGGGSVHPAERTGSLHDLDREAHAGAGVWIISGTACRVLPALTADRSCAAFWTICGRGSESSVQWSVASGQWPVILLTIMLPVLPGACKL